MQLYLIRHAESENNARPPFERVEDPALTPRGRLQAGHLADWLKTLSVDTLIASPFKRSLETTRHILDASPQTVHIWHDVFERGGVFRGHGPDAIEGGPGFNRHEVLQAATGTPNACVIDETISDVGWWNCRRRETDEEANRRADAVTERFVKTFGESDKSVVVVTHADFKRCLLASMLSKVADIPSLGPMINTGITKLTYSSSRWQLDWLNSSSHLPARLVTGWSER